MTDKDIPDISIETANDKDELSLSTEISSQLESL